MPLAKSAEVTPIPQTTPLSQSDGTLQWEGVPVDLYRMFSLEMGTLPQKDISQLKDIYEWAKTKCDEPTIGNVLQKLSRLENELGAPSLGEHRFTKMWTFAKMSKQIEEIDKRRDALRKRWL